jgi:hypothetical protein
MASEFASSYFGSALLTEIQPSRYHDPSRAAHL